MEISRRIGRLKESADPADTATLAPMSESSTHWKPLIVCPNAAIGSRLTAALKASAAATPSLVGEYPRAGSLAALAAEKGSNLCFLDVATNPEHARVLIGELSPAIPVVALLARNDGDLILRCLRRGACEFLTDIGADSVRSTLERIGRVRTPAGPQPAGAIWCVIPGKPGCGASTIAVHLAIQAKVVGPVLLVDADPLAASVAFQLGLKAEFHLGSVLRDWGRMDRDLWGRFTVSTCGIDVLAAPEDPGQRFELGRPIAADLCRFWRERYTTVIIDVADAYAASDDGFAAAADTILLVTTSDLAALQTTGRAIQCLDRGRLRLLLNRATAASGLKREDVGKALALEPFASLPNDFETLQAALLEGRPAPGSSRFGASIKAVCAQLQAQPAPPKKHASWISSILRARR